MSDVIIRAENLGKSYRICHSDKPERYTALRDVLSRQAQTAWRRLRRPFHRDHPTSSSQTEEFWALKDVSFEIKRGEVVGIIGRNGAGKSTLLKILSRITEPTRGRVTLRGRVASLLEVGTGFHPELTGRENIFLNGAILGMKRAEITRKFAEIVDFAGVEKFLDTPVKRYSSGMYVRLAFAVAAHLEPEILVVDEVLAVGDAEFQKKCLGKMEDVASHGRTVLFVSHNMTAVEALCNRAILLSQGKLSCQGETLAVLKMYRQSLSREFSTTHQAIRLKASRFFRGVELLDDNGVPCSAIPLGGCFRLRIQFTPSIPVSNPVFGLGIDGLAGGRVLSIHTPLSSPPVYRIEDPCSVCCEIMDFPLPPGMYTIKLDLEENRQELEAIDDVLQFSVLDADAFGDGRSFHRGTCIARSRWSFEGIKVK